MRAPQRPNLGVFLLFLLVTFLVGVGVATRSKESSVSPSGSTESDSLTMILSPDSAMVPGDTLDAKIAALQRQARQSEHPSVVLENLGWAFVEKARVSGDHGYYLLAERCARELQERDPGSSEADLLEGYAMQSLHRFAEAEEVAARLVVRRGAALDYALHGDSLLDLGRIDDAVSAYETMMRLRPDSRAYARAAEVRLLTGDLEGARDALRTAARAVSARDAEAFAWIWARLAIVELQSGNLGDARAIAGSAVASAPGSPVANFANGRILLATGDTDGAIAALELAAERSPLPETMRTLADAYEAAGREDDATQTLEQLEAAGPATDPRSYGLWLAESGRDPLRAIELEEAELEKRRDVYTFDALAVAEAVAGRVADAQTHMQSAMARGTEDPRLWYHAGLVAEASGETQRAGEWFRKAKSQAQLLIPSLQRDLDRRLALHPTVDSAPTVHVIEAHQQRSDADRP